MKQTEVAKSKQRESKKMIFGLVDKNVHIKAKMAAYSEDMNLEDWVGIAIEEKLSRKILDFQK